MIPSVFSILLSISIINTGALSNQSVGDINLPDTQFTQQTTLNSSVTDDSSDFGYFTDVQLPKIKERSLQEDRRIAELDAAAQKAEQEQLALASQEQDRIASQIKKIEEQQALEAKQREEAAAQQAALIKAEKLKAVQAAAAVAIPANTDYITLIRSRCNELGCNSDQVIRVMYCESGGRADAYNASSGASGLFQHMPQYWPGRAKTYGVEGASVWDPNAQIIVSTAMFSQGLASHWSCK